MELTNDNFYDIVAKNKYVIVKFYTKWCHYCKLLAPEYEKLYDLYQTKRKDVLIARIEGGANNAILARYGIYSFPIVTLFFPNEKRIMNVFRESREVDVMDNWIERSAPKIELKEDEVKEEKANYSNADTNAKENDTIGNELISNATAELNDKEITKESEYVKQEFMALRRKIIELENELKELKNDNDNNANNLRSHNNDNWIVTFEITTVNIGCLCGMIMIIIAIFAMIKKIIYKNKEIKGE